jgi:23S rRNA (uracil1939-C5)-methyltransferase
MAADDSLAADTPTARPSAEWLQVAAMDMDKGVARRADGKVVFIEGALLSECVTANVYRKKNNWEAARIAELGQASSQRVEPRCPHFGLHAGACGGCTLQHLDAAAQVAVKQRALEDQLWHLGKVKPDMILRPIHGPTWNYRLRARLSVRNVLKKGTVLVGFHERNSRYVADMRECSILPAKVSAMLLPLRALIGSMDARNTCPQIELACGEDTAALVLRHLEPLSGGDRQKLLDFGRAHDVHWWLQPSGPDSAHPLVPGDDSLSYTLPEFGVTLRFRPTDFTQVNAAINQVLVARAMRLLQATRQERVIDWFCGIGNFSLPMATRAGEVFGIEGSAALVARARQNYEANQNVAGRREPLADCTFAVRNLFEMTPEQLLRDGTAVRWLIDPPREGAFALVKALADLRARQGGQGSEVAAAVDSSWQPPKRIVYVSCNPATLARDAGLLVHRAGYRCAAAGVVNMFPHTSHVESMAVFDLDPAAEVVFALPSEGR